MAHLSASVAAPEVEVSHLNCRRSVDDAWHRSYQPSAISGLSRASPIVALLPAALRYCDFRS